MTIRTRTNTAKKVVKALTISCAHDAPNIPETITIITAIVTAIVTAVERGLDDLDIIGILIEIDSVWFGFNGFIYLSDLITRVSYLK